MKKYLVLIAFSIICAFIGKKIYVELDNYREIKELENKCQTKEHTKLLICSIKKNLATLTSTKILIEKGGNINSIDLESNMDTILGLAIRYNSHPDVVELLLKSGAENVNAISDLTGITPLIMACQMSSNSETIKRILKYKQDINHRTSDVLIGMSALDAALSSKKPNREIVQILLENHADIESLNTLGMPTLHVAVANRNVSKEIIELLILAKVNINRTIGESKITALMLAISVNNLDAVKTLIQHGANPNIQSKQGTTALMLAMLVKDTNIDIINFLLEHGADVNIKDNNNLTAIDYAKMNKKINNMEIHKNNTGN